MPDVVRLVSLAETKADLRSTLPKSLLYSDPHPKTWATLQLCLWLTLQLRDFHRAFAGPFPF